MFFLVHVSTIVQITVPFYQKSESGKAVSVQGNPDHTFTRGTLCGKVSNYLDRVYSKDRILHPMARVGQKGSSSFERVTWEEALNLIRDKFTEAIERDGSESILPYSYLGHQGLLNGLHCGDRFLIRLALRLVSVHFAIPRHQKHSAWLLAQLVVLIQRVLCIPG